MKKPGVRALTILLVEDNPGDKRLIEEALKEGHVRHELRWVKDGDEALTFLKRQAPYAEAPRPDLILLDLNLPKKDGREALAEIKKDLDLRRIPVVVLTSSKADEDILGSYDNYANCFISKPVNLEEFLRVVKAIEVFWMGAVTLPPR